MKVLDNLAIYIQTLNKRDFKRYLGLFLGVVTIIVAMIAYYTYSKSSFLVSEIKKLEILVGKSSKIIAQNEKLEEQEQQLQQLLEQNKEFSMKTFFEQFCSQQGITPDAGWETINLPVEGNDKFDEVSLSATFKNQTTQNLVKVLEALDKKEIIHIKELSIKNAGNKKITFDITIATKKYIG